MAKRRAVLNCVLSELKQRIWLIILITFGIACFLPPPFFLHMVSGDLGCSREEIIGLSGEWFGLGNGRLAGAVTAYILTELVYSRLLLSNVIFHCRRRMHILAVSHGYSGI